MSDFVPVEDMKRVLVECPVCTEYFDDSLRIPRRLPCCTQSICAPCLETYSGGRQTISCPICRQQQHLVGGVKSLPPEKLILRFLDHLKTTRNSVPSCTDCPDNNTAIAKCDTCSIFLCHECLRAHTRNRSTRGHSTSTFEQTRAQKRDTKSSLRLKVKPHPDSKQTKLVERAKQIDQRMQEISRINDNLTLSVKTVTEQINDAFDDLSVKLKQRKKALLREVETNAKKETTKMKNILDSHSAIKAKLEKSAEVRQSSSSISNLLELSADDVSFSRRGFSFVPDKMMQISSLIKDSGHIRQITFSPEERLDWMDDFETFDAITIEPTIIPEESVTCVKIVSETGAEELRKMSIPGEQIVMLKTRYECKDITCPFLEYDHNSASDDILTTGGPWVTNKELSQPLPHTGCRMQAPRYVFISKPLQLANNQRILFQVKAGCKVKQVIEDIHMIFHIAFCSTPEDLQATQYGECTFYIRPCSCGKHGNSLCFHTCYYNDTINCIPILPNKIGERRNLNIFCLLDQGNNAVHFIDGEKAALLSSVSDVSFDKPLWTMMYLGRPEWAEVSGEIISGNRLSVSKEMYRLLASL